MLCAKAWHQQLLSTACAVPKTGCEHRRGRGRSEQQASQQRDCPPQRGAPAQHEHEVRIRHKARPAGGTPPALASSEFAEFAKCRAPHAVRAPQRIVHAATCDMQPGC